MLPVGVLPRKDAHFNPAASQLLADENIDVSGDLLAGIDMTLLHRCDQ